MNAKRILAVGEVLWDSLPEGIFLGGATFNAAYHLSALGHEALLVSQVGRDQLGDEVERRMDRLGMSTELLQRSDDLPTGIVLVDVDDEGIPSYEIVENVAWDAVSLDADATAALESADLILFGSLSQRQETTREAIRTTWSRPVPKCFDVNLRAPYDDRGIVLESLDASTIVKLNDEEIDRVAEWSGFAERFDAASEEASRDLMSRLAEMYSIDTLCVTLGPNGARALHRGEYAEHPGFRVDVADTVGAGDAFLAAFLDSYFSDLPLSEWVERGNRLAAYVASCRGATPKSGREKLTS